MKSSHWTALALLVVGGLNWLMIGLFNFNLVAAIFGDMTDASRIVYALVGISALVVLFTSFLLVSRRDDRIVMHLPG